MKRPLAVVDRLFLMWLVVITFWVFGDLLLETIEA